MAFEYLDHVSDVSILASGETMNEAFCEAARGMFNLMGDLDQIKPRDKIEVRVSARTSELLLVEWLGELLAEKDLKRLLFSHFSASIEQQDDEMTLVGSASGEPIDRSRHELRTEVKGVTYAGLRVWRDDGRFKVKCVLDV